MSALFRTFTAMCALCLFCLAPAPVAAAPVAAAVSIPPQKYFLERIGGSEVSVTVMATAGRDPHTYEPTAAQMRNLAGAELYFTIGVPFESQWVPKFLNLAPSMRVVALPDAVDRIQGEPDLALRGLLPGKGHHDHHGHEHGLSTDDPHMWLSPEAMARTVPLMVAALAETRPEHAGAFRKRGEELLADMARLNKEIQAMFALLENPAFLTFHQGWAYYARNFNLREASVELEGREPGPRSMALLMDFAARNTLRVIVADAMASRASVEAVAQGINGRVVIARPLEEDWPKFLREFSRELAAALKETGGGK